VKKIVEQFKEKEPETPYLAAKWEWNERYWGLIRDLKFWRTTAIAAIITAGISSGGVVYVSSQHKAVPFFVEFNGHHEPVRVTRADEVPEPSKDHIKAALRSWVIGARTVYIDRRAQQDTFANTYAMTAPDSAAYGSLHAYHTENNPYVISQENTVEVAVNTVDILTKNTWRVEWTETKKDLSGKPQDKKQWQATVTVVVVKPTSEAQIMVNPVGMYVDSFSWAQRL
jgi:type IV secretory pathway TrbF-like protein